MDSTFFSESTGLYLYSALFQGNVALLGVLAVFVVFKSQEISATISAIDDRLFHEYESVIRLQAGLMSDFPLGIADMSQLYDRLERLQAEYQPPHPQSSKFLTPVETLLKDGDLRRMFDSRMFLSRQRDHMLRRFRAPLLLIVVAITFPLVMTILAFNVYNSGPRIELTVSFCAILYEFLTITWSTIYVLNSVSIHEFDKGQDMKAS